MIDTILILKIVSLFVIAAIDIISGITPAVSKRFQNSPTVISLTNAFSGGIFIAIAFIHLLPEEVAAYYELHKEDDNYLEMTFPLPYLLFFVGYTIILLLDKVIFDAEALLEEGLGGEVEDPV